MEQINELIAQSVQEAKNEQRQKIELLRARIELLKGQDKVLMKLYLENGISCRQLALLARMNESNIARRIQKLTKRLLDGEYIRCLRRRERFTKQELAVARRYFVQGLSQQRIAEKLKCSKHHVRMSLKKIQRILSQPEISDKE